MKSKLPAWLTVRNDASEPAAEIRITGSIGESWWDNTGISAKVFHEQLSTIPKGRAINLIVNSEGGSVQDGLEMYHAIAERSADITATIHGYALSIASVFPLAASRVISPTGSVWMIHDPMAYVQGNEDDMLKAAEMLDKIGVEMATIYAEATGKTVSEIRADMKSEKWMTGEEAIAYGLADDDGDDAEPDGDADTEPDGDNDMMAKARQAFSAFRKRISASAIAGDLAGRAQAGIHKTHILMNREQMIALLKTWGTPIAANATDEQLLAAVSAGPPKPATSPANPTDIAAIGATVATERRARISAEVTRRADGKIKNEHLAWWIDSAVSTTTTEAEQAVYAQIDAMAKAGPPEGAASPLGFGGLVEYGADAPAPRLTRVEAISKIANRKQRSGARRAEWPGLINASMREDMRQTRGMPVAGNTYSSTLITDFLVDAAVTSLQNRWAALECFTRDFGTDRYKPLATGQVKLVTSGTTTLSATKGSPITTFESGDSTVTNIPVVVTHYSQPFNVSQDELMSGLRMENLTEINLAALADTIIGAALTPLKAAYTLSYYHNPNLPWSWSADMPAVWAKLKKSPVKNLILDPLFLAYLLNQPGFFQTTIDAERDSGRIKAFGWDEIQANTIWTSAPTNCYGFGCNPQAIAMLAGLPQTPPMIPGATLAESTITIPGPDISIAVYVWFSLASRKLWTSYDVMFGAYQGDLTAGCPIYNQAAAGGDSGPA